MKCKICAQDTKKIFNKLILNKYLADYFHCLDCNFIQTEDPYWLEEAYGEVEGQLISRSENLRDKLKIILPLFFNEKGKFLDFAGGVGILTQMMREKGFDFYWLDKYCKNIFAKGFEHKDGKYEATTVIECFEHFVDPLKEIEEIFSLSDNIIFTTLLLPRKFNQDWWYFAPHQGQHISFYSTSALEKIAKKFDASFYSDGYMHLLTKKPLELRQKSWKISFLASLNKIFGRKKEFSKYGAWYEVLRLKIKNL